jgi:hypothetical protein
MKEQSDKRVNVSRGMWEGNAACLLLGLLLSWPSRSCGPGLICNEAVPQPECGNPTSLALDLSCLPQPPCFCWSRGSCSLGGAKRSSHCGLWAEASFHPGQCSGDSLPATTPALGLCRISAFSSSSPTFFYTCSSLPDPPRPPVPRAWQTCMLF